MTAKELRYLLPYGHKLDWCSDSVYGYKGLTSDQKDEIKF